MTMHSILYSLHSQSQDYHNENRGSINKNPRSNSVAPERLNTRTPGMQRDKLKNRYDNIMLPSNQV